jgi:hypothetical protein
MLCQAEIPKSYFIKKLVETNEKLYNYTNSPQWVYDKDRSDYYRLVGRRDVLSEIIMDMDALSSCVEGER